MTRRIVFLACALATASCGGGGGGETVELTDGRLTVVIRGSPASIEVLDGVGVVWATTAGAAVEGDDAPPLGFAGTGSGSAEFQMLYGSYKFSDRFAPWVGIEQLGDLVATADDRGAQLALS